MLFPTPSLSKSSISDLRLAFGQPTKGVVKRPQTRNCWNHKTVTRKRNRRLVTVPVEKRLAVTVIRWQLRKTCWTLNRWAWSRAPSMDARTNDELFHRQSYQELSTLAATQYPPITKSTLFTPSRKPLGHATQLLFLIHIRCLVRGWRLVSIRLAVVMVGRRDMKVVDVVGGGLRRVVAGIRGQCC
jgi:hypothetical protein